MLFWKILSVIIGVLGAVAGIYFREAYRRALLQKRIASQLSAYVINWRTSLLKEPQFGRLIELTDTWQSALELAAIAKVNGLTETLLAEQKQFIEKTKAAIKGKDANVVGAIEANCAMLKKMSSVQFLEMMDELRYERDCLISNKTFISDESAAELSVNAANKVVAIRTGLSSLLRTSRLFAVVAREQKHFDLMEVSDHCVTIIERIIQSSLDMHAARFEASRFLRQSTWSLTLKNLTGS